MVDAKWMIATIVISSILQLAYIQLYSKGGSQEAENSDVTSAIQRARTRSCKNKLRDFSKLLSEGKLYPTKLERSCDEDDRSVPRVIEIGCINLTNSVFELIDVLSYIAFEDQTDCLDTCFSYGYSYGGFQRSNQSCLCSDKEISAVSNKTEVCSRVGALKWYKVNNGIRIFKNFSIIENHTSLDEREVRIAFLLILNGRSIHQARRLLRSIYTTNHIYYLHVDKRDNYLFRDLLDLEKNYSNVIIARRRFVPIWGGPKLLDMLLDSMSYLRRYRWDYFINLSGSDLPIKPVNELAKYLSMSLDTIYLKRHNMNGHHFIRKQGLENNFFQCENRAWRMGTRRLPKGIVYSGGSDWFVLPRNFVEFTLENIDNPNRLVRPLLNVYKFTLLPAESFFHTLALNSKFCGRIHDDNLRITNWRRKQGCRCQHRDVVDWCGCSPLVYRWSDWKRLNETQVNHNLYFTRKFDPQVSMRIINAVEAGLIQKVGLNPDESDTRYWQSLWSLEELGNPDRLVFKQFGLFALQQVLSTFKNFTNLTRESYLNLELLSVDSFFQEDTYMGLVLNYCGDRSCMQILMTPNRDERSSISDERCFNSDTPALRAIEINHGFDGAEQMFRDFRPMTSASKVVVYHEWHDRTQSEDQIGNQINHSFIFSWVNPEKSIESVQDVKLKFAHQSARLSLAHRLTGRKPLLPGLWYLEISRMDMICLRYEFLVFDDDSFDRQRFRQTDFDRQFIVSDVCHSTEAKNCGAWSLQHRDIRYR